MLAEHYPLLGVSCMDRLICSPVKGRGNIVGMENEPKFFYVKEQNIVRTFR